MATYFSVLAWKIPWTEKPGYSTWGHKELDMTERLTLSLSLSFLKHKMRIISGDGGEIK